jgi:hypothetical protein
VSSVMPHIRIQLNTKYSIYGIRIISKLVRFNVLTAVAVKDVSCSVTPCGMVDIDMLRRKLLPLL